jgi:hypothetical protein
VVKAVITKVKTYATVLAIVVLTMPSLAFAGHHYGGNMNMGWDKTALDTDTN